MRSLAGLPKEAAGVDDLTIGQRVGGCLAALELWRLSAMRRRHGEPLSPKRHYRGSWSMAAMQSTCAAQGQPCHGSPEVLDAVQSPRAILCWGHYLSRLWRMHLSDPVSALPSLVFGGLGHLAVQNGLARHGSAIGHRS